MTRRFLRGVRRRGACACGAAVCLTALMAPACDKMPLTAPTGTTITLYASDTAVGLNGSVTITANVIESAGVAVQNGTEVNFMTTLGTMDPAVALTTNGRATARLLAGTSAGVAEVRAFSGGTSSADSLKIAVGGEVVVTVTMTVPASVTTTAPAEFSATATTTPAGATIDRYEWDFGDGQTRTTSGGSTSHLYTVGGGKKYIVSLRAVTASGAFGTAQRELVVQ